MRVAFALTAGRGLALAATFAPRYCYSIQNRSGQVLVLPLPRRAPDADATRVYQYYDYQEKVML